MPTMPPIHCDRVQPTLSNVWALAQAPSQILFPTFRTAEGPYGGASAWHVDEYIATV